MSDPATTAWAKRLVEASGLRTDQTFLDVGGGNGAMCAAIEELCGAHGTVLDPMVDEEMAIRGHVRGTAEALPFPDASFDAVLFNHVCHLLQRPVVAMRSAVRVLKPGGVLLVRTSSHRDLRALPMARWDPGAFEDMLDRVPNVSRIVTWMRRAGLPYPTPELHGTPFPGTFDDWVTGIVWLSERSWMLRGCTGENPSKAVEANLRGEFTQPEPIRETLLIVRRP